MTKPELLKAIEQENDPAILKAIETILTRAGGGPAGPDFEARANARWAAEDRSRQQRDEEAD